MGEGLARFGEAMAAAARSQDEIEAERDEAEARRADNELVERANRLLHGSEGYFSKIGTDADASFQAALRAVDAETRRVRETLRTPRALGMYDEVAGPRLASWERSTRRHAEAQVRASNREQAERRRSLAEQDAIRAGAADDPDGFAAGMMTMLAEVQGRSARDGLQSDAAAQAERIAIGAVYAGVVRQQANADPREAADDLTALLAQIDALNLPPRQAETARQRLIQQVGIETRMHTEDQREAADQVWAIVMDPRNTSISAIPPGLLARLAPGERVEVIAALRRNGQPDPTPDPVLMLELSSKAADGTLSQADLRRAWGRVPMKDWERAANWLRLIEQRPQLDDEVPSIEGIDAAIRDAIAVGKGPASGGSVGGDSPSGGVTELLETPLDNPGSANEDPTAISTKKESEIDRDSVEPGQEDRTGIGLGPVSTINGEPNALSGGRNDSTDTESSLIAYLGQIASSFPAGARVKMHRVRGPGAMISGEVNGLTISILVHRGASLKIYAIVSI